MSSSSQSKLTAKFQAPRLLSLGKRVHEEGTPGQAASDSKKRARRWEMAPPSDDEDDDDDACMPMSESQLSKHSRVDLYPPGLPLKEPDANKLLDAKVARLGMKNRAAEFKEMRSRPATTVAHAAPPSSAVVSTLKKGDSHGSGTRFMLCLWRTPQTRKHKTWDGDACLIIKPGLTGNKLLDTNSRQCLARDFRVASTLKPGDVLLVGSKEVSGLRMNSGGTEADCTCGYGQLTLKIEIDREIGEKEYLTGSRDHLDSPRNSAASKPELINVQSSEVHKHFKTPAKLSVRGPKVTLPNGRGKESAGTANPVSAQSFYAKIVDEEDRMGVRKPPGLYKEGLGLEPKSRYEGSTGDSTVMKKPDENHQKTFNRKNLSVVDVSVNPILAKALRPHQVEGVRFLYERVLGMRACEEDDSLGAILADEMGLGKTLQTITVIDMLLNQNCYYTPNARTIERALIVCPLSLVKNWAREFRKWLGTSSIKVQCIDDKTKVQSTVNGRYQVLIIGYEKLLTCHKQVREVQPKFGLIVCDEAHRLKNLEAKTSQMLNTFCIDRRILLSGTPIQNNLLEFHAMVDVVAPNLLGSQKTFKRVFEEPILKSRMPHASKEALKLGKERSQGLQSITGGLLLRRTAEILANFLPPKYEQVVFCSPTAMQIQIYRAMIQSDRVDEIIRGGVLPSLALAAIGLLRKLCNSPELLLKNVRAEGTEASSSSALLSTIARYLPEQLTNDPGLSGKMICVTTMLTHIKQKTSDKVVLVSNFTATLDILEAICRKMRFSYVRIDGQTKQEERARLISTFNQSDQSSKFVFLLSSKAGGTGINLIGANRLILFDSDWNPSTDRQAMARIHRDGQRKTCYIYRMLIPGTMDEKIYQRQISKLSLSDSLMDKGGSSSKGTDSFSPEELRDIFRLHLDTRCLSHDQMGCSCQGSGIPGAGMEGGEELEGDEEEEEETDDPPATFVKASQVQAEQECENEKTKKGKLAALLRWAHHDCMSAQSADTEDAIINAIVAQQKKAGIYTDGHDATDGDSFDLTRVKPGSVLFVYAEASEKTPDGAVQG